jgi:hypothetical protein
VSGRAHAHYRWRGTSAARTQSSVDLFGLRMRHAWEQKRRLRRSVEARRGGSFANQLRPDSGVLHRLTPRQHDDFTRRCTIILRGLTAGRHPLRYRLASPSFSPARVSIAPKHFLFLCQKLPFHRHFSHRAQRTAEISRAAERLRAPRCLRTRAAADNAVGGGGYTQN